MCETAEGDAGVHTADFWTLWGDGEAGMFSENGTERCITECEIGEQRKSDSVKQELRAGALGHLRGMGWAGSPGGGGAVEDGGRCVPTADAC